MTRIEQLINGIKRPTTHYADQDFYDVDIEEIMKRYAIEYADECLRIAANNARTIIKNWDTPVVNKDSILYIKFPEHT